MKKIATISAIILTGTIILASCGGKRDTGRVYMPDMAYSRAYETYAQRDSAIFTSDRNNKGRLIYYDNYAVAGTIKRGEEFPYTLPNDSIGYKMSANVKNPLDTISKADLAEAGRLFNINCAICHGEKAAGNGPISTSGKIGGIANLTLPQYVALADGTMYHVMQYGKNLMGSYASQLDRKQRWMIIKYIRTLQPKAAAPGAPKTDSTGTGAKADSTGTAARADSSVKKA